MYRYTSILFAAAMAGVALTSCGTSGKTATDHPVDRQQILFADPTVFTHDGKYYLSGTRNREPLGFTLLESTDLVNWHTSSPADSMIVLAGRGTFGSQGFWAPQLLAEDGRYIITYTADEQTVFATADSISGPYTQATVSPIDPSEKNIDSFLFTDVDGTKYLYHVRFDNGNYLWVARFDPATATIDNSSLTRCFVNDQAWEHTGAYPSDPIMEGPTVVIIDGTYYMFYSANHFMSPDYAVGYATAPSPMGPWTKNPANPIINKEIVGEKGSGHGDLFVDNDGGYRYVYHVHHNDSVVSPRRTRIVSLSLVHNDSTGIYDITVDPSTIITPLQEI